MRCSNRRALSCLALISIGGCSVPTDESGTISLELVDPPLQVLVGSTVQLDVQVAGAELVLGEGDVAFSSSDSSILSVDSEGAVTGVGEGKASISARMTRFENAVAVEHEMFASRGIVVQSLVGEQGAIGGRLRFSEVLKIRGLRLDPDSLVNISIGVKPAEVEGYTPRDPGTPGSLEELRLYVPIAADQSELLLVHANGGSAAATLRILQEDVFEVLANPYVVDVGPEGWIARDLTVTAPDEDRMILNLPAGEWTIAFSQRSGFSFTTGGVFGMQIGSEGLSFENNPAWARDHAAYACNLQGRFSTYYPSRRKVGVTEWTIPIQLAEARSFHTRIFTEFGFSLAYRVEVRPGYESDLPPDAAESNDFCTDPSPITIGERGSYNWDNGSDHDWYSFTVPGPVNDFASVSRFEVEPNNSIEAAESLNLDVAVEGDRNNIADVDYYRIEANAGELLDIEALSDRLPLLPGRDTYSEMNVDLRLYDEAGQLLAFGGYAAIYFELPDDQRRLRGSDARILYLVPETGTYYIHVDGNGSSTNLADVGPHMYYRLVARAHKDPQLFTVDVETAGDPGISLVEHRPNGVNVVYRTTIDFLTKKTVSELLGPGEYSLLLWPETGPAEYMLTTSLGPPMNLSSGGSE